MFRKFCFNFALEWNASSSTAIGDFTLSVGFRKSTLGILFEVLFKSCYLVLFWLFPVHLIIVCCVAMKNVTDKVISRLKERGAWRYYIVHVCSVCTHVPISKWILWAYKSQALSGANMAAGTVTAI